LIVYKKYIDPNVYIKVAHCANADCTSASSFIIDSVNFGDADNSITIGADGLGLISYYAYYDVNESNLKVAHCNDIVCSDTSTVTLDDALYSGLNNSVAIGSDGLGLISYLDFPNRDLVVVHCDDPACLP
jgi:hypothetical protein